RRVLLEERVRERELRLGCHGHRSRRREQVVVAGGAGVGAVELPQGGGGVEGERADPPGGRGWVLDARGGRGGGARPELVLEVEHHLEPTLRRDVARARGLELG